MMEVVMEVEMAVAVTEPMVAAVMAEAMVAVVMAVVVMVEETVAAAMVAETAAHRSPRRRSTAPRAAPTARRMNSRLCCRREPPRDAPCRSSAHTRSTPIPTPRHDRNRCDDSPAALDAYTDERRTAGIGHRPRSTSRCASSHPCPHSSCRKHQALRRMSTRAANSGTRRPAGTEWVVVTAAAMVEATEEAERAAVATVAVTVAAARAAAATAVETVEAAMVEVERVAAMAEAAMVAAAMVVVTEVEMAAEVTEVVTVGCLKHRLRSTEHHMYGTRHSSHRCDRYCPALQHAARQETRARTPPTSRSAGHLSHTQ